MMRQHEPAHGARVLALWILAAGFVAALLSGLTGVTWLREGLRHGCSWAPGDGNSGSDWFCADGNGYLLPGAAIMACNLLALLLAAALVLAIWKHVRPAALALAATTVLAVLPTVLTGLAMLTIASARDAAGPDDASRVALWVAVALPALLLTVAAGAVAAVGLWLRARGGGRRPGEALVAVGLGLLLLSVLLSGLGTLWLALVAASIFLAAWYLAAGADPVREEGGQRMSARMSIEGIPDRRPE